MGTQKVLLRYIRSVDYALLTPEQRAQYDFRTNEQTAWKTKIAHQSITQHAKAHDPALFAAYGNTLMKGTSYLSALNYYFRAFAITPDDPILNLSIGLAYIQHAMKRLSENRHFQLLQGLTFVHRYHELRTKDNVAVFCSEAEFNMGRVWHLLGLTSQAVECYDRCITLSKRVQEEAKDKDKDKYGAEDFATEAAFALQTIFAMAGDFESARRVTEAALVIE